MASGRQRKAGQQELDSESRILTLLLVLPGSTVGLWDVTASLWASVSFASKTSFSLQTITSALPGFWAANSGPPTQKSPGASQVGIMTM